jgi:dihydroneopterin aldolase
MPHYAHMVSVNRLQVHAHLGFYTGERAKLQPIEICFRLYFPTEPVCSREDEGDFIDYGSLCKVLTDFIATSLSSGIRRSRRKVCQYSFSRSWIRWCGSGVVMGYLMLR